MIDAARMFLFNSVPQGPRLAVMSVSGGAGVLIADGAEALNMHLPPFADSTRQTLRSALPAFVHPANPVDLTANVLQDRSSIGKALTAVSTDPGVDCIVLFVGMMHSIADAFVQALSDARKNLRTPLVVVWIGALNSTVTALESAGLPVFGDIPPALHAIAAARHAQMWQREAINLPLPEPGALPDIKVGAVLSEWDGKQLLRDQTDVLLPRGTLIPPQGTLLPVIDAAFPVAVKLQSAALTHKSDAGGVLLRINSTEQLTAAAEQLGQVGRTLSVDIQGILVEEMVAFDHELLLGLRHDPHFGAVLTLARGGVQVELDPDAVSRLLPLGADQIEAMLRSLRSARLLEGFRGRPVIDMPAIATRIAGLCAWFAAQCKIQELEINPLALRGQQAWALDALVTLSAKK